LGLTLATWLHFRRGGDQVSGGHQLAAPTLRVCKRIAAGRERQPASHLGWLARRRRQRAPRSSKEDHWAIKGSRRSSTGAAGANLRVRGCKSRTRLACLLKHVFRRRFCRSADLGPNVVMEVRGRGMLMQKKGRVRKGESGAVTG
jgi:hypothetical protein